MNNFKQSPIFYEGNKYELLIQIFDLFPTKINNFYDIFGGSGTISINFLNQAKNIFYNEANEFVYKLFNFYKDTDPIEICKKTKKIADKFGYFTEQLELFQKGKNNV